MIELDEVKLSTDYVTIFRREYPSRDNDPIRITLEPFQNTNLITVYRYDESIDKYYSNVFVAKEKTN